MKKIILLLFIFLSIKMTSQSDFTYKFKIDGITSLATAKPITDPLRVKFSTYPVFNDSLDMFEIHTNLNFTKTEIQNLLSEKGFILNYFSKNSRIQLIKIKEEDEQ